MTPRQAQADAIHRALRKHFRHDEVSVENVLPLRDDEQLKIKVVDHKRNEFIERMCGWSHHWIPSYYCVSWRTSAIGYGLIPAAIFEVKLERERPRVPDVRKIPVDVTEKKKSPDEEIEMRKVLGLK
jgi:hypothetical protein